MTGNKKRCTISHVVLLHDDALQVVLIYIRLNNKTGNIPRWNTNHANYQHSASYVLPMFELAHNDFTCPAWTALTIDACKLERFFLVASLKACISDLNSFISLRTSWNELPSAVPDWDFKLSASSLRTAVDTDKPFCAAYVLRAFTSHSFSRAPMVLVLFIVVSYMAPHTSQMILV